MALLRISTRAGRYPCPSDKPQGLDTRILKYVSFKELAPTPENPKLLEQSPHRDVPIVDGSRSTGRRSAARLGRRRRRRPTPRAPAANVLVAAATSSERVGVSLLDGPDRGRHDLGRIGHGSSRSGGGVQMRSKCSGSSGSSQTSAMREPSSR